MDAQLAHTLSDGRHVAKIAVGKSFNSYGNLGDRTGVPHGVQPDDKPFRSANLDHVSDITDNFASYNPRAWSVQTSESLSRGRFQTASLYGSPVYPCAPSLTSRTRRTVAPSDKDPLAPPPSA